MAISRSQRVVGRSAVAMPCDACRRAPWHSETNPGGPPVYAVTIDGVDLRLCTEPRSCIAAAKAAGIWGQ